MSEVYAPAEDTFLLADVLKHEQLAGKTVLEIGCGSGFLTKIAVENRAYVTAVDINPSAVEATKKLLSEHKLTAHVFLSDLFEKIVGKFDFIVFNPPYLPENEDDAVVGSDTRYSGGRSGREVIERFIAGVKEHLGDDGKVLLLISSVTGEREVIELFKKSGLAARVIARKKIEWESLIVIEASRPF